MKNWGAKHWIRFAAAFGFASFISFCQIDGAWADAHHFNGLFGWLGIGIITGLAAIYGGYKMTKTGNFIE